ncbi:MAG: alanine racemase [Bdellovibrionales bacterium]|nr:alanine racemase [Bdellovibrionales bacterium]
MRACLEVDLKALKENVKTFSLMTRKEKGFFCPIVKANSYGHGALEVTKVIKDAGVRKIGVISIDEALALKELASDMEIYIFAPFNKTQMEVIDLYHFIPVVGQWADLKALTLSKRKEVPFHLKFNTGMNRFGFPPSEHAPILEYIKKHPLLKLQGLASHLSEGELAGSKQNSSALQQIHTFKKIHHFFKQSLPNQRLHIHLLNSAGFFALWCHSQLKNFSLGFRPGICLYGIKPPVLFSSKEAEQQYHSIHLKPVSCLKSFVVSSHTLPAGQPISYGGKWVTQKKSTLAVVSMGYADGLPYRLFNKGEILFRGERVPIVGHICMDFFMIDVTAVVVNQAKVQRGEEVVIFGTQKSRIISVEEQSDAVDSIPEEILTRLGERVHRIYHS